MSRRALTLVSGTVLAVLLAVVGGVQKVPYVALGPGPAINTLGRADDQVVLTITGAKTYPTDGSLALTTVSVRDHLTLFEALEGWVSRRQAVIPREIVFPPDSTPEEEEKKNTQEMTQSQDDATQAALGELGLKGTQKIVVATVKNGAPADTRLKPADVLTSVDGTPVTDAASVGKLIGRKKPGESVVIGYVRDGRADTVTIPTIRSGDAPVRPVIGISAEALTTYDVKVDIKLKDIGGPSAGLMFALGIIDKLGPDSLTGGRSIAGTGTIDAQGKVGPIGGIAEKMIGAKDKGATVFLSPADNCAEAKHTRPDGLTLIRVDSLKSALAALKTLREGGTPPSC